MAKHACGLRKIIFPTYSYHMRQRDGHIFCYNKNNKSGVLQDGAMINLLRFKLSTICYFWSTIYSISLSTEAIL